MKKGIIFFSQLKSITLIAVLIIAAESCHETPKEVNKEIPGKTETPEYFILRPKAEKDFGYSHAVRIGNDIKISGAVSMDEAGTPTAVGDLNQQMKNCYSDLEKVLKHYGCTFDDVTVENIFTTNMAEFLKLSSYRNSIYTKNYPTGTWLEVKGLALPGFMIEIELEAHKAQ
jgi:2-iminobutanoate/2-iminopropanoate deaminase